jgi:phosphoadenosine phosphosulfate reductase
MQEEKILGLNKSFKDASAEEILGYFLKEYKGKIAFATSLGAEDQVITHMIADIDPETKIFTLDTGRLFQETYNAIERTNDRYGINIEVYFPDQSAVEKMVNEKGINLFYASVDNRKLCCNIRKTQPLKRALDGMDAWVGGLRRQQSVTREDLETIIWDPNFQLIKISPLINWSEEDVWKFIKKHNIPYNKLHDKGYPSIGCMPCTRPVKEGEDVRAGRWWWENPENKECGIHDRS